MNTHESNDIIWFSSGSTFPCEPRGNGAACIRQWPKQGNCGQSLSIIENTSIRIHQPKDIEGCPVAIRYLLSHANKANGDDPQLIHIDHSSDNHGLMAEGGNFAATIYKGKIISYTNNRTIEE